MGLFRWLERKLFLGEVIRDYGVISEHREGLGRSRTSLLLVRRRSSLQLVIRASDFAVLAAQVRYHYLPVTAESVARLKSVVADLEMFERAPHTSLPESSQ